MTIGSSAANIRPNSLLNGPCRFGKCCCRTISLSGRTVGSVTAVVTDRMVAADDPNPAFPSLPSCGREQRVTTENWMKSDGGMRLVPSL
jgi:hypothetical protein